ncbi:MAG TPA: hypothetical protein VFS24_15645 [Steroidobacteraceae bacterium]|nr:hypothetical protein [Steroidobacteraceae bacterium]
MIYVILLVLIGIAALVACMLWIVVRSRNMQYWIGSYWKSRARRRSAATMPSTTVYVCMGDHYEPFGGGASHEKAMSRVSRWVKEYPEIARRHRDSLGRVPQHSFFYPIEEYHSDALAPIAELCKAGFGDVEIHYHHDNDTAEGLEQALRGFAETLHERHGLLRRDASGQVEYCFIHGNWALDNSRPDGRWCGVDNELSVLVRTGCRVDYSMPSAPDNTQTRKINSIYFARGQEGKCKSHNDGRDLKVGMWGEPDELLLVQGPLGLNWRSRKFGIIPRIENGEISADAKPTRDRIRLWLKLAPRIEGASEHVFVKLHTHGATDAATPALLGGDLERMWSYLESEVRDRPGRTLRYVTAWEMYQIIKDLAHSKQPATYGASPQEKAAA